MSANIAERCNLSESAIEKLQDLVRINIDSHQGLQEAARQVQDLAVESIFREIAAERKANAEALKPHILWQGESPTSEGSYLAAFHRTWMELRAKLSTASTQIILAETQRGEEQLKAAYRDAIIETEGTPVATLLKGQFEQVVNGLVRIEALQIAIAKSS